MTTILITIGSILGGLLLLLDAVVTFTFIPIELKQGKRQWAPFLFWSACGICAILAGLRSWK